MYIISILHQNNVINSTVNKSIDIYQIGTTLYRMCNGNEEYNKQVKRYKNLNDLKIAIVKRKISS